MAIPGTIVNVSSAATPNNPLSSTGTFFAIGQTSRGATGVNIPVTSLTQFVLLCGDRGVNGATPTLYDAVDVFFQEGGQQCNIARVSGANATLAAHTLVDRAGSPLSTLTINALGPGTWGNVITVQVANGTVSNSYVLTIVNGTVSEVSPNLFSPADAVNWAATYSKTVRVINTGSVTAAPNNNPAVVAAVALSGGVDDTSPADSVWVTALTAFPLGLGMGQVAAPGRTTPVVWEGLVNHAQAFNRFALLDGENIASAATIEADAATVSGATTDPSYGIMLASYPSYPGLATGTATPPYPRVVSPSAGVAGAMARLASAGKNADTAAAGNNGFMNHATDVSQIYSDTDRGGLDVVGVGVVRKYKGNVQLYGYTTLALDPNWSDAGNARLRMQIVDTVHDIGDNFMFADIDGQGHTAAAFGGQIAAFLNVLYNQDALFGATAADAFSVNVGPSVNTPATAQARELLASVAVRMSPTAEQVIINITRYPVTQTIPS